MRPHLRDDVGPATASVLTAMTDLDGRTANVFGGIAEQPNAALEQRRCYLPHGFQRLGCSPVRPPSRPRYATRPVSNELVTPTAEA